MWSKSHRDPSTLISQQTLILANSQPNVRAITINDMVPTLRSRLAWNIVPDRFVVEWAEALHLTRPSAEVARDEAAGGVRRLQRLLPFHNYVVVMATLAADLILTTRMKGPASQDREPDGTLLEAEDQHAQDLANAITASSQAIIANLLDLGILDYGKAIRE
jgi:hypothetical protein